MSPSLGNLIEAGLERYPWAARIPAEARNLPITDADAKAAWELYVELVTRVATQPLEDADGVEVTALESIAGLFGIAREIMRKSGPDLLREVRRPCAEEAG